MKLEVIQQLIKDFFGDTTRTPLATKDGLHDIAELAEELAATIDVDDEESADG